MQVLLCMRKNLLQSFFSSCFQLYQSFFFLCTKLYSYYLTSVASHTSTFRTLMNKAYNSATQQELNKRTVHWVHKNYPILYSTLLLLLLASCKKADITFGSQLLDNGHTQIIKTDTVTVEASTVYIDSFVTNNKSMGLVGVYRDPYFGLIKAKSFIEVAPPAFQDTFQHSTFDSLEIVLALNKNYYGDTSKPVSLNIYRLFENLAYVDNSNMYNNSNFSLYAEPIATKTFLLRPNEMDSMHIRLSDALGEEWLSMLQNSNSYMTEPSTFREYFKGFCIAASGDDGPVFGFSDSISVRLHYRQEDMYSTSKELVFNIFNRGYQFNNISVDRTGTAISNISSANNEINTTQTNNTGYMQYITGTMVKLHFPYIRDLLQINGFTSLAGAELRIRPVASSFSNIYPLPSTLRLATTQSTNQFLTNLVESEGQTIQDGSLQIDGLYGINTYYNYDVTDYIKYLLGISQNNKYGLLLAPLADNAATTFNRLLVQDNNPKSYHTELILYYISVQ